MKIRRSRWTYTILMLVCIIGFWLFENFYTPNQYPGPLTANGDFPFDEALVPSSTYKHIVVHDHYMLSYSEPHEQAEWVAYTLKKEHLTYDDRERPYFIEDPKVGTTSADWKNYRGSGYDRGHLCPAGDRRFSEHAYNETFYTSNISPQDRDFNAGVWNRLEMQIRRWCKAHGTLYVITGGVLEDGLMEIGMENVDVPRTFYKIVFQKQGNSYRVLAFLMPNRQSDEPLSHFLVSIDAVEKATGLDFFYKLDDGEEKAIEEKVGSWKGTF